MVKTKGPGIGVLGGGQGGLQPPQILGSVKNRSKVGKKLVKSR